MEIKMIYQPDGKEYVLIEFQGDLECDEEENLNFLEIGNLAKIDEKKYMMKIGIYDLVGNIVDLKEPILVNEKVQEDNQVKIYVRGVCNKKILFNQRPTPILERAMKKKKKPQERQSLNS
ncbi:hypothetical protein ABPG72_010815 [Tetrahymena utriculariae]